MKYFRMMSYGFLFFSFVVQAYEWHDLDVYQQVRTREYVQKVVNLLLKQDASGEVAHYAIQYLRMSPRSLKVFSRSLREFPDQTPEYEYFFAQAEKSSSVSTDEDGGTERMKKLRISIDSSHDRWRTLEYKNSAASSVDENSPQNPGEELDYEKLVIQISNRLVGLLREAGATVDVPRLAQDGGMSLQERADHMNAFKPDAVVTLAFNIKDLTDREIPFVNFPHEMVSFVPGCFLADQLHTDQDQEQYGERFRYRFVHALVSGKFYESAKLGYFLSQAIHRKLSLPLMTVEKEAFSGSTCPIPSHGELTAITGIAENETIPGIGGRNLFVNGVFAQAVAYVFPYIEAAFTRTSGQSLEQWADEYAEAYFEGIRDYLISPRS